MKFLLSGMALFLLTATTNAQVQNTKVLKSFGNVSAVKNTEVRIPVILNNVNVNDVKNVSLTLDIDGVKKQINVTPQMQTLADGSVKFFVTAYAPNATGLADVTVTVDAINGIKTFEQENVSRGKMVTVSRNVEHKVLIEKYTAIWCPTCPTGIVGIERTKLNYGDKVIVVSAHSQDPLTAKDYKDLNKIHMTLPRATVDRDPVINEVNPYLGTQRGDNGAGYGLGYDIEEQMAIAPVVEVKVNGGLDGKKITIKSEVTTLYNGDANLGVAYVITQDSLSNPQWVQKNSLPIYYRDHEVIKKEPLFEEWFNGEVEVPGVVYDDVVRAAGEPLKGYADVIPTQVKEEETFTHEQVFDMGKYVKVKDTNYMNLIVMVIDNNTGKIVNSATVKLSDCNDIQGVEVNNEDVVEVARYTIDGQRIAVPTKGVNVVKLSNGTVRKELVK